ncbi:hypothetical protein BN946_scf185015.g137 [Trametes cinnabarina]|uniref:SnoaL-like domain-containing protein n=1 Tax=Pycnoporus cinnabarinus TaxID=5643 RepID=A0A060SN35_PYCCI|nr:hypothetical protein BN946_scf185015.g137 [Trametes cinnabarina]
MDIATEIQATVQLLQRGERQKRRSFGNAVRRVPHNIAARGTNTQRLFSPGPPPQRPTATTTMHNTVSFPTVPSWTLSQSSVDSASALSLAHHRTAADVCELFYGETPPAWEAVERFYDPHATYENPFLTATSKDTISDVHALAHTLSQLNVPKPWAVLLAIFRMSAVPSQGSSWFRGLNMWNEVNNISECDTFDGHKRTMVEHTLHILILPGLHSIPPAASTSNNLLPGVESALSLLLPEHTNHRHLHFEHPNISFLPPSPFHLKLPIITRLSFNDAGKITHHRDFWDVKDLLGLVPGMTLIQWISSRIVAQSIRGLVRVGRAFMRSPPQDEESGVPHASRANVGGKRSSHD